MHRNRTLQTSVCTGLLVLIVACGQMLAQDVEESTGWPQYRGVNVDGISLERGVFSNIGELSLAVVWKRPIGVGISGVAITNDLAVTMAQREESTWVVALDPETGRERWRSEIAPAYYSINGTYDGPFSTPVIAGNAVVALDMAGHLAGLDRLTGDLVWSVDLTEEFGSREPNHGFATSPVLLDGRIIVQIGAENAAIAGFDPNTGLRLWTVGSDQVEYQTPVPATLDGRRQLVAAGQTHVMGIDHETGELLWQYAHNGDGFTGVQSMSPVVAGTDTLFLANKHHSSVLIELSREGDTLVAREQWEQRTIRNSFNVPVFHDGYLYGYSSRFLVCIDAETGEAAWRSRPPGDGFLILVDEHLIILTKEGSLHVVKASPEAYQEVASLQLFDDAAWTHPSFANGHIYARSYNEIARIDVRSAARLTDAGTGTAGPSFGADGRFERFLQDVSQADDKTVVVDRFIESVEQFPLVEGDSRVHFIYRGPADDVAIAGDIIGARIERPMTHVAGTDLFYHSTELDPAARVNYHFIRDYEEITDPRNPRTTTTMVYGPDMEVLFVTESMTVSWMSMPLWQAPSHLDELPPEHPRGRLVRHELESEALGGTLELQVYLPHGYRDGGDQRYPVAFYHDGGGALTRGQVLTSLDNLIGDAVRPVIVVFVQTAGPAYRYGDAYIESLSDELIPFVDATYRTIASPASRASLGGGFDGVIGFYAALRKPDLFGKVAVQSVWGGPGPVKLLARTPSEQPLDLYLEWGAYDVQSPDENWDFRNAAREVFEFLVDRGYAVTGGQVPDGTGWSSWKNRTDRVLRSLFPLE